MKTVSLLNYKIYDGLINQIDVTKGEKKIVNTINPHSYIVAKSDPVFKKALKASDYLLVDGIGIVIASYILRFKRIARINGPDLFNYLIKKANLEKKKVFFLGASQVTLNKIDEKLKKMYPNVQAEFFSPPFKSEFSKEDNRIMIQIVNDFNPDILFVGMTAPKQEKWVYENGDKIHTSMICSIGAVFDFFAETVKMPNEIWIKLRLIWLIRFIKEPRKLWRRNFVSMPLFLLDVFLYFIRFKRIKYNL